MTKKDYIARVLLIMNEAGMIDKDGNSFIGADTAQIDRHIEGSFVDAWRRCAAVMPRTWLMSKSMSIFGAVAELAIVTPGSGFSVGDIVALQPSNFNEDYKVPATIEVTEVSASGGITAFKIVDKGSGYEKTTEGNPINTIDDGSKGSGAAFNVLSTTSSIYFEANSGTGYVVLPKDFYLLTKFKLKGWIKAVYEASLDNERVANIQSNPYTRGSTMRPVCVIDNKMVGGSIKPVMHFYSLPKSATKAEVEEAFYVPLTKPLKDMLDDEDIGVDSRVIEPMAYLSASTVYTLLGNPNAAQGLEQRAIEMFPALKTQKGTNVTFKQ